jgi:hypothetical protein
MPSGAGRVDVGAALDEQPGDRRIPLLRREHQRRESILRLRVDVVTSLEQRAHDVQMVFGHGTHQRGLAR